VLEERHNFAPRAIIDNFGDLAPFHREYLQVHVIKSIFKNWGPAQNLRPVPPATTEPPLDPLSPQRPAAANDFRAFYIQICAQKAKSFSKSDSRHGL